MKLTHIFGSALAGLAMMVGGCVTPMYTKHEYTTSEELPISALACTYMYDRSMPKITNTWNYNALLRELQLCAENSQYPSDGVAKQIAECEDTFNRWLHRTTADNLPTWVGAKELLKCLESIPCGEGCEYEDHIERVKARIKKSYDIGNWRLNR